MRFKPGLAIGAVAAAALMVCGGAIAAGDDFKLILVKSEVSLAKAAAEPIEIKLVGKSGQAVPDATFTRVRLDMAPDGMAMHTAKATLSPTAMPGVYRLEADYSMTGRWQLSVAARVSGESETVTGKVVLTVAP